MIGGLSKFVFNQLLFVSELKTTSFGHRTDTHGDGDRRRVRKDVQRCTSIFNNVEYFSMSGGFSKILWHVWTIWSCGLCFVGSNSEQATVYNGYTLTHVPLKWKRVMAGPLAMQDYFPQQRPVFVAVHTPVH